MVLVYSDIGVYDLIDRSICIFKHTYNYLCVMAIYVITYMDATITTCSPFLSKKGDLEIIDFRGWRTDLTVPDRSKDCQSHPVSIARIAAMSA